VRDRETDRERETETEKERERDRERETEREREKERDRDRETVTNHTLSPRSRHGARGSHAPHVYCTHTKTNTATIAAVISSWEARMVYTCGGRGAERMLMMMMMMMRFLTL